MKNIRPYFQIGSTNTYTDLGCSTMFLEEFCNWLEKNKHIIKSVDIALYLFNNLSLYNALEGISESGCKVTIYSIPLEGYDRKPANVLDHITKKETRVSKYDLAKSIYDKLYVVSNSSLSLRIVPHIFLRSANVKKFSRGSTPYSLHCKTACIQFKNGNVYAALTSSNMAVRDAEKHEVAVISLLNEQETESTKDFFGGLYDNSVPIGNFDNNTDYPPHTAKIRETPPKSRMMYVAPFYRDSAFIFEDNICTVIKNAKKRIVVCAQHVCAYQYYYPKKFASTGTEYSKSNYREGFLSEVLKQSQQGVPVTFLSQTYSDKGGNHGCSVPENTNAFINFVEEAKKYNCHYYQNNKLHCKFIVADDTVIITTCNFTPTQFIYLADVKIDRFENIPNYSYAGIHCEYGAYQIIHNSILAEKFISYASQIIEHKDSRCMF